jgi:hypothetical protein
VYSVIAGDVGHLQQQPALLPGVFLAAVTNHCAVQDPVCLTQGFVMLSSVCLQEMQEHLRLPEIQPTCCNMYLAFISTIFWLIVELLAGDAGAPEAAAGAAA